MVQFWIHFRYFLIEINVYFSEERMKIYFCKIKPVLFIFDRQRLFEVALSSWRMTAAHGSSSARIVARTSIISVAVSASLPAIFCIL